MCRIGVSLRAVLLLYFLFMLSRGLRTSTKRTWQDICQENKCGHSTQIEALENITVGKKLQGENVRFYNKKKYHRENH